MRHKSLKALVPLLMLLATVAAAPAVSAGDGLLGSLQCPCGCGKFLSTCDCSDADSARAFVASQREMGKSDAEIADAYGAEYGEAFVNFVPKKGSGLSLWAIPPLAVLVGAAGVYYVLTRKGTESSVGTPVTAVCEGCGSELDPGQNFCPSCGAEVTVDQCGNCGAPVEAGDDFCASCGSKVG